MVDRFRLLKKAFIANKQGFKEFGSEEQKKDQPSPWSTNKGKPANKTTSLSVKENQLKNKPEIKDPRVKNFFSLQREQPKSEPRQYAGSSSSRRFSLPSFNAPSLPKIPAAIGVYIGLIILSLIGLFLKSYVAYHPGGSLFISIIIGFFFFIAIHYTPEAKLKETMVFITFALDTFTQFVLGLFPESEVKNWLITYYVFAWVILAAVLFLMGIFDTMGAGEHLGKGGLFVLALIMGFVLFLLFPIIISGPIAKQDETHAEYYGIAKAQIVKIAGTLKETKNVWYDYFTCTFGVLGGNYKYDTCIEDKRIVRYCKNNVPSAAEQQSCFQEQKKIVQQGGTATVEGTVSEAIKKVTKVELKVDEFFPKKTTEPRKLYPISLAVQNPRQQTFLVSISCLFTQQKTNLSGVVFLNGQELSQVQINEKEQQVTVDCQPSADLKGKYTLSYTATLSGMQTFSFLKRAFISEKIDATLRKQIEADNFKTKDKTSQGPAEFALLNFKFGTGDGLAPLVLAEEPVSFSFSVANVGGGEVLKVNSYDFQGLWERGFSTDEERVGDNDCLQGGEIRLIAAQTKKREASELKRCYLTLPPDLGQLNEKEFKVETFVADLNYDYKLTKSIPIEVTPLEVIS